MVTECKYAREANFYDYDKFFPKIVTKARAKHLFFPFTLDLVSPSSLQWIVMK